MESGLSRVTRYTPDGDKVMRLHAQTATIENGFVHPPSDAPWLAEYLRELTLFPSGRHDDQVDATAQALAWAKQRPPSWGLIQYYRLEHERRLGLRPDPAVRLLAPEGISHVQGMSGRTYMVRDRLIEVDAADAPRCSQRGSRRVSEQESYTPAC